MSFYMISNWDTAEWTDEMEALAREKYVPMIMSLGAKQVKMIRTGDNSFTVFTEYADEAAAQSAQERVAAIRAEAADELPMTMAGTTQGPVFAGS